MRDVRTLDLSNFKTAKKGKRFVCVLIDYFLLVIFSFMMFSISNPIYENLSYTKKVKSNYETKQNETIEILKSTYLEKYDESNVSFVKIEKDADEFIKTLVKTSFYFENLVYYEEDNNQKVEIKIEEKDTFYYVYNDVYVNDRISQYYLNFRNKNKESYNKKIEVIEREDLNKNIFKLDGDNKDLVSENFILNNIFWLSSSNALLLSNYINFNDEAGKSLYTRIKNMYVQIIDDGIIEVENYYQPYLDSLSEFKTNLYAYSRGFDLCIIISYLIAFIICYILFPLCFKRGRTLSYKVNSLFPLRNDNLDMRWNNYLIKYLLLFVEQFSGVFFLPLFISKLNVLSMPFIFNITMFQLIIFSFLFSVLSLVFFFISKDNQTLSEFASNTYTVDSTTSIEEKKSYKGYEIIMNETVEVEYIKPALYKRWFSSIIDFMLVILFGILFFSFSSLISKHIPSYISNVNERNEIQNNTPLYDDSGSLIILSVEKSSDTYTQKKNILNSVIEEFYKDKNFFKDNVTYYSSYQERKKEATNKNGNNLFKLDEASNTYIEKSEILDEDYYNFYYKEIENYSVSYLSLNSRYKELTDYIFIVFVICLFIGMTISFLIFYLLIPLLLKRGHKTVGMYLFKISYISVDALNISYKQFFVRFILEFFIGYLLSIFTFGLPLIVSLTMMHLSKAGQDFFDYVTNTYVVDSSKKDVYLDYSEYTQRQDMSKKASIEDNDYKITK